MGLSPKDFGASFQQFMETMHEQAGSEETHFIRLFREHFEADPKQLPIVSMRVATMDHASLQRALEEHTVAPGRSVSVSGVQCPGAFRGMRLLDLIQPGRGAAMEAPMDHVSVSLGEDEEPITCVRSGVFRVTAGDRRWVLLIDRSDQFAFEGHVNVEVMAQSQAQCEEVLREIRASMHRRNVHRGRVVSIWWDRREGLQAQFRRLPTIRREDIILPEGLLERIERHTIRFTELREEMLSQGRHLRRGILLFGPPGTGKTLTAMHLVSRMEGRTVIVMTGRSLGLIEHACAMARTLQPSTVILEDVDLIAEKRDSHDGCATPVLFELLNEMDGVAEDADLLFLLTTNRPDMLEPALAARPGRIDQAFEIPLPDSSCRRRLFDLYGQGLTLEVRDRESVIQRTEGASAAFIKELMRRSALFAADEGSKAVTDRHFDEALLELVVQGGELTKSLLGFKDQGGPSISE